MQTDSWGPHAWETLHHITFGSPVTLDNDDKIKYKLTIESLRCVIPCSLCRSAFGELLNYIKLDDYIDTRDGLCYWMFVIHNLVNRKLDKSLETFDNVIYKYENMRARCGRKGTIEYTKCKEEQQEFPMHQAKKDAIRIRNKFKTITEQYIYDYYYSDKILDPKFQKCSV
jgi:hypothetical protein